MTFDVGAMVWLAYVVAGMALTVLGWLITRNWRPVVLARVVRVWLAVILLTPAYVEPGSVSLAPAWAVTLFALLGDRMVEPSQGYVPLLAALSIATILIVVGVIVQAVRERVDSVDRHPGA